MGKGMLTEGTRFFAMDTNKGHYDGSKMTAAFSVLNEEFGDLPLEFLVNGTAQSLPQQLPDADVLSSGVEVNEQGIEIGVIEVVLTINDVTGNAISVYERMLFVQNNELTPYFCAKVACFNFRNAKVGGFNYPEMYCNRAQRIGSENCFRLSRLTFSSFSV